MKRVNVKYYKQKVMALTLSGLMMVSNTGCFKIKDNNHIKEFVDSKIDLVDNTLIEIERKYIYGNDVNYEIDYEKIPSEIHGQIKEFEEKMINSYPKFNLNKYRYLVNENNFIDTSVNSKNYDPYLDPSYDKDNKNVYFDLYYEDGKIYPELFEMLNPTFKGENNYGEFIEKAIRSLILEQVFDVKIHGINRQYAQALAYVVGSDKLLDIYFNGNIYDLENVFTQLTSQEEAINFIQDLDKFHNAIYNLEVSEFSEEMFQSIQKQLVDFYINSINKNEVDIEKSKEFISNLFYSVDLFLYNVKDSYSKEYFDEKIQVILNNDELYKDYLDFMLNKEEMENKDYLNIEGNIESLNLNNLVKNKM